ncbi:MAG: DNA polymerase [Treponema sp.]|nr:DNA polymerase [Treponema sp.]MCL2271448.1 DNA polymerase [Treponema sp.]
MERNVSHLNVTGFKAIVAALEDSSLLRHPFIIAGGTGGRTVAWDVSPAALKEGITRGMPLAAAQRLVRNLTVVQPDAAAYARANARLEKIISRYAPLWQNDGAGNIYLDITGTRRIFGHPADCVSRIRNEISDEIRSDKIRIEAAAAIAANKLVSKVASRAIRPLGLITVRAGEEASFLNHQDIALLPGLGPSIMKTIRVTGLREAGELAALSDSEAFALFGKKGILLRDSALGIDDSPVAAFKSRVIQSTADFPEDVIEEDIIRGSIASISEHAGLEMRRDKTGTTEIKIEVLYGDGMSAEGKEKTKHPLVLDRDITAAAQRVYNKAVTRRIRVRSISLSLEALVPLIHEPDLFEVETETKSRKLQEAVDRIQERYGAGKVTRGINPKIFHKEMRKNRGAISKPCASPFAQRD